MFIGVPSQTVNKFLRNANFPLLPGMCIKRDLVTISYTNRKYNHLWSSYYTKIAKDNSICNILHDTNTRYRYSVQNSRFWDLCMLCLLDKLPSRAGHT